jgi:hypothetical protein
MSLNFDHNSNLITCQFYSDSFLLSANCTNCTKILIQIFSNFIKNVQSKENLADVTSTFFLFFYQINIPLKWKQLSYKNFTF